MPGAEPRSVPGLSRGLFLAGALLTLGLFLAQFSRVGYGIYGDGLGYYAPLRSLLFDGDLDLANEFRRFAQDPGRWPHHQVPGAGRYPVGTALLLLPFLLLGHLAALGLRAAGLAVAADGLSWPYELSWCLGSVLLGLAGLALCARGARRAAGPGAAAIATAGVWFASPLTYYLIVETSMSHALSLAVVAAFLHTALWSDWIHNRRRQVLLGALLGLAFLVRLQDLAVAAALPVLLLARGGRGRAEVGAGLRALLAVGATAGLFLGVQLLFYLSQYGGLHEIPYLAEARAAAGGPGFAWTRPHLAGVLFSGFRGLFLWHPFTFLGVAGLLLAPRERRAEALALGVAFAAQVYVTAAWKFWWGGASMGQRMLASAGYSYAFGAACLIGRFSSLRARRSWGAGVAALALWNALLMFQYRSGMIPAEAPVPVRRLLAGQVLAIPAIAQRLLRP